MEKHPRTRFDERGLVGSHRGTETAIPLFSGSMHYWRVAREDWRACLVAAQKLGFEVIDTYIPWAVHEIGVGRFEWGEELDLGAFLDEAAELGLSVVVRPGPHINAELGHFGFPERLLRDERMLAVSARGTPVWLPVPPRMFPVPSYASLLFRKEVARWLSAVGEIVGPRQWPNGPVVAVQVDNESQMFFRVGAFDHDYHQDALDWWRQFAPEFAGREVPRKWNPDAGDLCAAWVRFKEDYCSRSLAWIAEELTSSGIDRVARFHNFPPAEPCLSNLPAAQRALGAGTAVGIDFYHRKSDYLTVRRRAQYLSGSARPLPFVPELGVGGPPWLLPMSEDDQRNVILGVLAAGVRAFNLYMLVDRERWYGAPIATDGSLRGIAPWIKRLLSALREVGWTDLRRRVVVGLVLSRAESRFAVATSVADPVSPVITEFLRLGAGGFSELATDEAAVASRRWNSIVEEALNLAQVPYELVDEDNPAEGFSEYAAVIAPTIRRVDRAFWQRLKQLAHGGVRVVVGPHKPTHDELDRELGDDAPLPERAGLLREQVVNQVEQLAADLASVAGTPAEVWVNADDLGIVDCSLFVDQANVPRVLFVGNRGPDAITAQVLSPAGGAIVDLLATERTVLRAGPDGVTDVPLAGFEVRMFAIEA